MRFQLDITLTEEDYLDFNVFHSLETAAGKKMLRNSRILFLSVAAVVIVMLIITLGWTTFSAIYVLFLGAFAVIYTLRSKKAIIKNIKKQMERAKKTGKLPFDPAVRLEFYEDKMAEITADKRLDQNYSVIERICVWDDRAIYLYNSSVGAHILPIPQLKEQLDQAEFLSFLSQKCNAIEYYQL